MVPDRMRKGMFPSVKLEPLTCRPASRSRTCEGLRRASTTLQGHRRRVSPTEAGCREGLSCRALPSDSPLWEAFLQRRRCQEPGSQAQEAHQPHQEQEGLHPRQTGRAEVRAPGREGVAAGRGQALEARGLGAGRPA